MEGNVDSGIQVEVKRSPSRARDILKRVPGGDKFLPPEPGVVKAAEPVAVAEPITPPVIESAAPVVEEPVKQEPQYVPSEPEDPDAVDPDTIGNDVKAPAGENAIKRLRSIIKNVSKKTNEYKAEAETLRKKVTDYETGLAMPELVSQQQARLEELEKYEKIYAIKSSPTYRKRFVEPLAEEKGKLNKIATDYKIDPSVLDAAYNATSVAEQNRILSAYIKDDIGALEAKSIFSNMKKIENDALEAEKEPVKVLARIEEENKQIVEAERHRANEMIANTSRDAWTESLSGLREDKRFPELVYREGDTEHNEKVVRPILTRAGQEYGKIIKILAQHGLTALPKEAASAMSRMTQLAHQAGVLAVERSKLQARVSELEGILKTRNTVGRPGVNGNSNASSVKQTEAKGPAAAARNVLGRVLDSNRK